MDYSIKALHGTRRHLKLRDRTLQSPEVWEGGAPEKYRGASGLRLFVFLMYP